ncbi:MAG: flagellar FlbD family protein [bacterium]|nr:flagellar FlbD family protein [bacterium]
MIRVTRFNKTILYINADMIEFLESTPDTIITLNTGRKVLVRETVDEVIDKVVTYKRRFLQLTPEVRSR